MASVEQRANDWRVVWRQDGTKQYERFPTEKDAEDFADIVTAQGNRWPIGWVKGAGWVRDQPSSAPTFGAWAERSIASRATANPRTRHDYLRDLRRHLLPTFGTTPIDRITREEVGLWLVQMGNTVSAKTLKNVQNLASSILSDAVDQGLAPRNPFRGTLRALPASKHEDMGFLSRAQFATLLDATPEHYQPLVLTLGYTGMRWSEATALKVGDVDLLGKRVTIVRAWKRTPENHFVLGEPKSRRSRRTLVLPKRVIEALIPLAMGRGPEQFVFTTQLNHPVRHSNFRTRAWVPAVEAALKCSEHGSDPCECSGRLTKSVGIHSLRHSHASWLIADGATVKDVQQRLGHESAMTTLDRYGHLVSGADDKVGALMEAWDGVAPKSSDLRDPVTP